MHDTLFGRAGTRVGVLQEADDRRFMQAGIGAARGQPTGVAFGTAARDGRFRLPPEVFRATLDQLG